jgi:hypothetical protein
MRSVTQSTERAPGDTDHERTLGNTYSRRAGLKGAARSRSHSLRSRDRDRAGAFYPSLTLDAAVPLSTVKTRGRIPIRPRHDDFEKSASNS